MTASSTLIERQVFDRMKLNVSNAMNEIFRSSAAIQLKFQTYFDCTTDPVKTMKRSEIIFGFGCGNFHPHSIAIATRHWNGYDQRAIRVDQLQTVFALFFLSFTPRVKWAGCGPNDNFDNRLFQQSYCCCQWSDAFIRLHSRTAHTDTKKRTIAACNQINGQLGAIIFE